MKINVALFGLGRIGIMHAQNIKSNLNFNLKYIYDINKKLSSYYSKKFKTIYIKKPSIVFNDKNIHVIFISSTTSTHIPLIIQAAKERDYIAQYWSVWKSKKGGLLQWQKKDDRSDFAETHELSPNSLKSRIEDWFQKTDAGTEYDKFFKISKGKFFKPRSE